MIKKPKNTLLFAVFTILVIVIIIGFYYSIKKSLSYESEKFYITNNSIIYDKDYNYIKTINNSHIYKNWDSNYYLTYVEEKNTVKYNLGHSTVTYYPNDNKMYGFGTIYQVFLNGDVTRTEGKTEINRGSEPTFYKLDDRKYLIVSSSINSSDNSISTSNYLLVDIDKIGNALLVNDEINVKTINPIVLNTKNFSFDVANEKLIVNNKAIDLKNVIGSTNEYKEKEEVSSYEIDDDTDYLYEYFNTLVNKYNKLTEHVNNSAGGSTNNTFVDSDTNTVYSTWLSLSSIEPSVTSMDINYIVFDPTEEYATVFIYVSSSLKDSPDKIILNKESTNYKLRNLEPDIEYTITLCYVDSIGREVEDDVVKAKTVLPNYKIEVSKVTNNKIYANLYYDSDYVIDSGNIVLYSDDVFVSSTTIDPSKLNNKNNMVELILNYPSLGNKVVLKLADTYYNGEKVNIDAYYKYYNG